MMLKTLVDLETLFLRVGVSPDSYLLRCRYCKTGKFEFNKSETVRGLDWLSGAWFPRNKTRCSYQKKQFSDLQVVDIDLNSAFFILPGAIF